MLSWRGCGALARLSQLLAWGACWSSDSRAPIGDCGIVEAEINGRREYDLGYIIHHLYWRQGFGVECARACLDYGIHTLGLKRIVANMPHDHTASARVAERLGMRREATFHNPRNRNILTYLYALNLDDTGPA